MAEALNARASATVTRSSIVHADDGTVDGKAAVSAVLDLAQYGDVGGVTSGSVLARVTSGTGKAELRPPSAVLDIIGATQGSLLYRGSSAWSARTPGTAGLPLVTKGASADPVFEALSLGALAQGGATNGQVIAWNGSAWAPATVGGSSGSNISITSAVNVVSATHAGNKLFLTSSGALTVNASTAFGDYAQCEIYNWTAGNSTVAAIGITIDVPTGLTAVISQGGVAILTRKATAGNYHLAGDLVAA